MKDDINIFKDIKIVKNTTSDIGKKVKELSEIIVQKRQENPNNDSFFSSLNSPPTLSLFRVYILSFIIYNKSLLLYIIFGSQSMEQKLLYHNWSYFVYFYEHAYLSLYLGPAIVCLLIYILSTDLIHKNVNLYNVLYIRHMKSKARRETELLE